MQEVHYIIIQSYQQFSKDGYWNQTYHSGNDEQPNEERQDQISNLQYQIQKQFDQITTLQDILDQERNARYKAEEELVFKVLNNHNGKQRSSEQTSYVTLYKKYEFSEKQLNIAQTEIQKMSEEIELLAKRLEYNGFNSSPQINQDNVESKDTMIQRLNMRITSLKMREDQLLQDNATLEERLSESFNQEIPANLSIRQPDNIMKREMEILESSKIQLQERLQQAIQREKQALTKLEYQAKEYEFLEQQNDKLQSDLDRMKEEQRRSKEHDQKLKQMQIEQEATIYALEQTLKANSNSDEIKEQLRLRMDRDLNRIQEDYNKQTRFLEGELESMKQLVDKMRNEATKYMQQTKDLKNLYDNEASKFEQKLTQSEQKLQQNQSQVVQLQKQTKKMTDESQKIKIELSNAQDQFQLQSQQRDKQETKLKDKIIVLQDQIANIMREKQQAQSNLSQDMNHLQDQYRSQHQTLQTDNKDLEKKCLESQLQLQTMQQQNTQRENELMKEVKLLQQKLQQLMDQQIEKREKRHLRQESKERLSSRSPKILPQQAPSPNRSHLENQSIRILQEQLDEERIRTIQAQKELKSAQLLVKQIQMDQEREQHERNYQQQQSYGIQDLQHSVAALRHEKERVGQQIEMKDQQLNELHDQINRKDREQKSQENVQKVDDQKKAYIYQNNLSELQNEVGNLRHQLIMKSDTLDQKSQEIIVLQDERRQFNEQIIYKNLEVEELKENLHQKVIDSAYSVQTLQKQVQDILQDHKESQEQIYHMKLQSEEQKQYFEELICKLNNIIDILKEKFQNDLQELQTRQNIYFNQNNVIKQSLSQQKEFSQLTQLIQQYSDNVVSQTNNLAKIKQVQDQKKQITVQLNTVKEQLKTKTQLIQQMTLDNQELQKKVERYRPRNYSQKQQLPSPTQHLQQDTQPLVVQLQEGLVAKLESDVTTLKTRLRLEIATIEQLTLVNKALEVDYKNMQNQVSLMQQQVQIKDSNILELQKHHKNEIEKAFKGMSNMQSKFISEDKVSSLQDSVNQRDLQIKELQNELARRRDVNQQFRSDKEDKEQTIDQFKKDVHNLQEENEKLKKQLKESIRKDSNFKDIKEKIDQQKQIEKQTGDENKSLQEKLKQIKIDLQRKEGQIKELKEKLEEHHNIKQDSSDKKDKKEQIKRLKEEVIRKEQALKHFKTKLDEKTIEVELVKNDHVQKYSSSIHDLEREQRKSDQIKILQKKQENQINMLLFLLKRIYRENYMQLQQGKLVSRSNAKTSVSMMSQYQQSKPNLSRFSESMNILNISPDDLEEFLEPNAATKSDISLKKTMNIKYDELDKFDETLSNLDNVDVNKVFQSIQNIIQERVDILKN